GTPYSRGGALPLVAARESPGAGTRTPAGWGVADPPAAEFPPRGGAHAVAWRQLATAGLQFRSVCPGAAAVVLPGAMAPAGAGVGCHAGVWCCGVLLFTHPAAGAGAVTRGDDRGHASRATA